MTEVAAAVAGQFHGATTARRATGVVRLAASAVLLAALAWQIVDKTVHDDMVPAEYFSYFTIQSSMIAIVVLAVGGWFAVRRAVDPRLYTAVRMSVLAYAAVTAAVYNVLLRGIPDEGYVAVPWPGEVMHVWIPVVLLLDWLLSPGRPALRWATLGIAVAYPLAWIAFTLVRGALTAWYPYPFLEPQTGAVSVLLYIAGIAVFIIGLASLAIVYSRRPRSLGREALPPSNGA